jgi:hypothetical protein
VDSVVLVLGDIRLAVTDEQARDLRRQLAVSDSSTPMLDGDPGEVLTTAGAAPLLGCSPKYVRGLCALPRSDPRYLRHVRKGREILIRRRDLAGWIARQVEGDDGGGRR